MTQLREALSRALPEEGSDDAQVIDELVRDTDAGILASAGGRFFGWVIGGGTPAALAADWLTSTWDQNAALHACGPAEAVIEEVAGDWLKQLLRLPPEASFAFTTGAQQAHVTALAAARTKVLADRGWDVERRGMAGAPTLRVLTSGTQHASIERAVRLLGLGADCLHPTDTDDYGRIDLTSLQRRLAEQDAPTVLCLQAGEINTGAFDSFTEACRLAHDHGAWVHVDGAFGLWAAVSERHRHLLAGVDHADSWTTDGHKWLNVPFDSGFAFVRHPGAHHTAMSTRASYLVHTADVDDDSATPPARDQIDWNPEWSRRGRAVPVYAAIRALGRRGIADIIERCSDHAYRLAIEIGALNGAELLVTPRINQGLVRFLADNGDHDARTEHVIDHVQRSGEAWFSATTWNNMRAMRISVVNWQTSADDITRAITTVHTALDLELAAKKA
ncbi:glutamate/tyrosine decarboxylase-like PLP-dependent enzyme [Saccharopolyspora lacisalsi]|uniref:Glutamate/tyrosine decarboxylase-like PLP-dependent enzyme n=1 Tax=Halosaccharopolyspora lacisalsi TaxID=1000566 RepID=A0A839DYD1_9PSEU|nr:aminotransferase class V-fold PLP-dependent enzyme [Halosaccharopolyspora lacisalsi]MBA8823768.1 glutamate/tyrosine decarboxylase-like PLP-dependent enzyme [Halosaccharopolyspora lacisalsi]